MSNAHTHAKPLVTRRGVFRIEAVTKARAVVRNAFNGFAIIGSYTAVEKFIGARGSIGDAHR